MKKIFTFMVATLMAVNVMASDNVTGMVSVSVGSVATYSNESVTYTIEKYTEDGVEKMNVVVPSYELSGTIMGNLSLGSYTVKGLVYDSERGGFYRDYKDDGLSFHFKAVNANITTMDKDYEFSSNKDNNILVKTDGTNVTSIVNHFQMGYMPFAITSTFTPNETTGIESTISIGNDKLTDGKTYNLRGEMVNESYKGLVIRNGKKFVKK